ncbi:metalloregulator ArsR/SmtB family transcription factor [Roseicyclus sp. F158]|uniref:Metalloregulator ArsR/SmtB family transcription factor n=1 Tax=Tropicimonas omnivorans TaxID=3075590 RepID=A0ABU3DIL8_9RHOB|nr:metalloregulator ArsR/SmtB family transcription factor [Roseicyclus sp. F158]MDT0683570.1 metalloregulator ArsR/SmtB family transcription factor [Roseicyclus sp. F158]
MASNLDGFYSALADPTRRAVVERLMVGPAPVSELYEPHDMALPSFLKHLGKLESAGIIRSEKSGRVRTVHIEAIAIAQAENWLKQQRRIWERRLDRLSALAEHVEKERSNG